MTTNKNDVAAGAFFVAVGLLYGGIAWKWLPLGQALNMGPGYFPMVLSSLLTVLGAVTVIRGFWVGGASRFGIVPWRAVVMLSLATIIFATFLRELGLFPCVFASAMTASLASPQITLKSAAIVSLMIAAFCIGVFTYGISIPIPVFGSWFVG
jgi:hypothetical protein